MEVHRKSLSREKLRVSKVGKLSIARAVTVHVIADDKRPTGVNSRLSDLSSYPTGPLQSRCVLLEHGLLFVILYSF